MLTKSWRLKFSKKKKKSPGGQIGARAIDWINHVLDLILIRKPYTIYSTMNLQSRSSTSFSSNYLLKKKKFTHLQSKALDSYFFVKFGLSYIAVVYGFPFILIIAKLQK
jgi:hypothetical protein